MLKYFILTYLPLVSVFALEPVISGGDYEQGMPTKLYIRQILRDEKGQLMKVPPGTISEKIQSEKVHGGQYSLQLECSLEKGGHEINCYRDDLPLEKGRQYEFSFYYFIEQKSPAGRVAGRVTFFDADKKVIRYIFPEGNTEPGKWHQLKERFYPPVNAESMSVTIWLTDKYRIYLDDVVIAKVTEQAMNNLESSTVLLGETADWCIWKEANYLRVPYQGQPENPARKELQLTAAANEREPFQLVVSPKKELKNITLDFSELRSADGKSIPAAAMAWRPVGFINLKNPDNPGLKGWIADPMLHDRAVDAPAGVNTPLWVMVNVPGDAAAGTYRGRIRVCSNGGTLTEFPLTVNVRSFRLPDQAGLKTFFYGHSAHTKRVYKDSRPEGGVRDDIAGILQENRINGNQSAGVPVGDWKIENGRLAVTDWRKFDDAVRHYADKFGFRNFCLGGLPMLGDNSGWFGGPDGVKLFGHPVTSETGMKLMADYAVQVTAHVKKEFPGLQFYSYLYDEPPTKVMPELKKILSTVHEAAPDLKIFIPKTVTPELPEVFAWCVPFADGYVKPALQQTEQAKGKEIWYYNWRIHLDKYNYIKNRLYAWQIYANDGCGGLLWSVTAAPDGVNPWDEMDKTHSTGGATLIYPAREPGGNFHSSQRLAQVRECIDDFDYFLILEKRIDGTFPGFGKRRVKEIIRRILPELPFGFVNDPHLLYSLRDRIGDEIDMFNLPPVSMAVSDPAENSTLETSRVNFIILGPDGAAVSINGRDHGRIAGGRLETGVQMVKLGTNEFKIAVTAGKNSKTFVRSYELKADPQLRQLADLRKQCAAAGIDTGAIGQFLNGLTDIYLENDRAKAGELLAAFNKRLLDFRLKKPFRDTALTRAVNRQAQWAYSKELYERAGYYLKLQQQAEKSTLKSVDELQVEPVMIGNHFGFKLCNKNLEAVILETGARIISFKVNGVECFAPGDLEASPAPEIRASGEFNRISFLQVPALGGYTDASIEVLPESAFDWDLSLEEISAKRIAVSASVPLNDGIFRLTRTMSLEPESRELKIAYRISNVMPLEFISDDPASYELAWRGRLIPAIGDDGPEHDTIVVPTETPLPATQFLAAKPVFYELRSVPLNAPYLGAFDPVLKTGFAMKLDPQIKHAYLWMNSKGDRTGKGKVYTLEVFRSFYGNQIGSEKNTPFSIKPGETVRFNISLTALPGIASPEDFKKNLP